MDGGNLESIDARFEGCDPQDDCQHVWKIKKVSATVYEGKCETCGLTRTEVLHLEYWHVNQKEDPYIRIGGKRYRALKGWSNIAPCSDCGNIFFEGPIILWSDKDHSKAIVFCPECGERILENAFKKAGFL